MVRVRVIVCAGWDLGVGVGIRSMGRRGGRGAGGRARGPSIGAAAARARTLVRGGALLQRRAAREQRADVDAPLEQTHLWRPRRLDHRVEQPLRPHKLLEAAVVELLL